MNKSITCFSDRFRLFNETKHHKAYMKSRFTETIWITYLKPEYMKIGIAADHKGYVMKQMLHSTLLGSGYKLTDFGAFHLDVGDDCGDFIIPLALALQKRELERGIA